MHVKAFKGSTESTLPCTHVVRSDLPEHKPVDAAPTGIRVKLCGGPPDAPAHIDLPADADIVYVLADTTGNAMSVYRWPLRPRADRDDRPQSPANRQVVTGVSP